MNPCCDVSFCNYVGKYETYESENNKVAKL